MKNIWRAIFVLCGALLPLSMFAQFYQNEETVSNKIDYKRRLFNLEDIRLLDGPFKVRQDINLKYLKELNADRFIHHFRYLHGLPTLPGIRQYDGWESGGTSCMGHYLSAMAYMYASTGDEEMLSRIKYMVDELELCQSATPELHNALIPYGSFKRVMEEIRNRDIRITWNNGVEIANPNFKTFSYLNGQLPWYVVHKVFSGLRDAYLFTGYEKAKTVFLRLSEWCYWVTENLTEEEFQKMLMPEHGGMNEVIADAYALSGDEKFLKLSQKFNQKVIMRPCETGSISAMCDVISHIHANNTMPKFVGRARQYELSGADADYKAASNFLNYMLDYHVIPMGGNSEWEGLQDPGKLSQVKNTRSSEGCNTYNVMKIAEKVYEFNGSEKAVSFYERALYNHILAAIDPKNTGAFCYYMPMKPGHFKTYSTTTSAFWCCVGSGMENPGKYAKGIYANDGNNLFINLFIASVLDWKEKGVQLTMNTNYPEENKIRITIDKTDGQERMIQIRYPQWADRGAVIAVNGQNESVMGNPGEFISLTKKWTVGDNIEITLPCSLRVERLPDEPETFALFYGPVILAADLGNKNMPSPLRVSNNHDYCSNPAFVPIPFFKSEGSVGDWLEEDAGKPLNFKIKEGQGFPANLKFMPYYEMHKKRYTIYMNNSHSENHLVPQEGKYYRISFNNSGRYLTCSDGQTISTQVKRNDWNVSRQIWKIQLAGTSSGSFRIVDALDETKCLDINNTDALAEDVRVVYGNVSNFDADQRWTLHMNGEGVYLVNDKDQTLCMDVYATDKNTIHLYEVGKGNANSERFIFMEVEDPTSIHEQLEEPLSPSLVVDNNTVYAECCEGKYLTVYTALGVVKGTYLIDNNDFSLELNGYTTGIYIARVENGLSAKVIIKGS